MKTNRFARRIWRFRIAMFCVCTIAVAFAGYHAGDFLKQRSADAAAAITEPLPVPRVTLHDLMAAAR